MRKLFKHAVLVLIFCSIYTYADAQAVRIDMSTEANLMSKNVSAKITADGSPYVDENFAPARISEYKNQIFNARFNAYNGEMEVSGSQGSVIALDNNGNFTVVFTTTNKIYQTVSYTTDKDFSKRGFLVVVLEEKNNAFFKEERIKFFEKVPAASSYQQGKPAKFQRADDNYYVKINEEVSYVPQKKKDFLKAFPKQASALKTYMKKEKLNPKNEDELLKLITYLFTLTETQK